MRKIVIIVGGSRGIGKATAIAFARTGAQVVILARDRRELAVAAKEIAKASGVGPLAPLAIACDVVKPGSVKSAIASVVRRFKKIDVLVDCAAIQTPVGPFISNDMKAWERTFGINLFGTTYLAKEVLPSMIKARSGVIINFGGGGSTSSRPNFSAYAVSKTAVLRFTEILAHEVKPYGIRVNAIAPGTVVTRLLDDVLKHAKQAGKSEVALVKKRMKDGGTPPELAAELAVFLASDAAKELTGRLVSAPWDDWRTWDKKKIREIMKTDKLTLRRIV